MSVLVRQFGHPRGWLGRLAGWIMETRPSNLERNRWTVELLDLEPADNVLELGPGPGVTLGLITERCPDGAVVGLDHSAVMVARSCRANKAAVATGRLSVMLGDFVALPAFPMGFDKIVAVHSLQFDAMAPDVMKTIVAALKPGGTIAITFQPRGSTPSEAKALAFAENIKTLLAGVGLAESRIEKLDVQPVCAICVLANKAC